MWVAARLRNFVENNACRKLTLPTSLTVGNYSHKISALNISRHRKQRWHKRESALGGCQKNPVAILAPGTAIKQPKEDSKFRRETHLAQSLAVGK